MIPGVSDLASGIVKPLFSLIDNLFTSDDERATAKLKLLRMEQAGELETVKQQMSLLISDSQSKDKWTSRARPSFLYVMYFLFASAVPVGILSIFNPEAATQLANGMGAWLNHIPEELWNAFWICFTGYTAGRTYEKAKGVAK